MLVSLIATLGELWRPPRSDEEKKDEAGGGRADHDAISLPLFADLYSVGRPKLDREHASSRRRIPHGHRTKRDFVSYTPSRSGGFGSPLRPIP